MLKKIIGIGVIGIIILVIIGISLPNIASDDDVKEMDLTVMGDVIMPTKVSRPGCEDTDRCYIPSMIVVDSGSQVTWVNEDSAFHSVTSGFYNTPTKLFDSGHLDPFESYTVTFDEAGIYDYFCTLHPWMKGQVIVE